MKKHNFEVELGSVSSAGSLFPSTSNLSADADGEDEEVALHKWLHRRKEQRKLQLGLSFSNLKAHGFLSSANYQHTFGSYLLALPNYLRRLFGSRHESKVQILHSMDGLVKSGEMLLVLGRPGSGCSTYLKTIAGDTHGFVIDDGASINYQGLSYSAMHTKCKAESIYVAELDVHFPELKLGQTLEFAAGARSTTSASAKEARDVSRWVASMFNLGDAFETPMGNDMIRGVSGGEKKRATIAEAFMGGSQVQCWDNSTRGLDSATALDLIVMLRGMADELRSTVLVSVYQASETMYRNFDRVMLLYEGRQIFFGPTAAAVQYFTSMGFVKSAKLNSADFLTSLTNPSERVVAPGYERRVPRTPDEFTQVWKQSLERSTLSHDIEAFNEKYPVKPQNLKNHLQEKSEALRSPRALKSPYAIPTARQVGLCLKRAFRRLANNSEPVISGIFGNAIIGVIIGSVFYNLNESSESIDSRALLLFFSIMLNACTSGYEILTIWAQRPIVEKHSRYSFHHPFTEAVAAMICDLPNKILTSLLFNLALYFLTNLRRAPNAFFIYYLFCFAALLTMSMVFRMMGSLSKRIEQSMAPGAIMIANLIIYTGFVVPIPYMVPWFGWMRWINPIFYAYESIMINEFRDRRFPCSKMVPSGPTYAHAVPGSVICSSVGARPGQNFVDGTSYIREKYEFSTSHLWRNLGLMLALMAGYCAIYLLAVEYIPAERSKGEILLFRRYESSRRKIAKDEEANHAMVTAADLKGERKDSAFAIPASPAGSAVNRSPQLFPKLQRQHEVFHWLNVCYDVKISKKETRRILNGIDGWVNPGTLTALMGATGAGKTTLLNVLASRTTTGVISGDILVGGRARHASFQRQTGFVQQADIHTPTSTVREALRFAAILRQPKTYSRQQKIDYVDHVLQLLEMEEYADAIIGVPGEGLNVEQRRRLSIAVEMVARPELLLFLDEPTSGLDSQTAWSICSLLRKLADHGQAILCTIHQPSAQLFDMFDQLLLLEKGGNSLYFGEIGVSGNTMVRYFERYGARRCEDHENPAEWMLDVTGATPRSNNMIPWANVWSQSDERQHIKRHLQDLSDRAAPTTALPTVPSSYPDEYAASYSTQMIEVIYRIFQDYWRTPSYLYSKFALCIGAALFNGFSFWMADSSIQGLVNVIFSIFLLTNIFTSVDQQIIPKFIDGRALFEAREMRSKTYSWHVFVASHIIVELTWQTLVAVLVFISWYYPTGIWRNGDAIFGMNERAVLAFLFVWFFCLFTSTFSQAMAAAIEHTETAVNMAQLLFYLCVIFCGVIMQPSNLPGFWKFMYRVSPLTYLIHGLASAGVANMEMTCSSTELLRVQSPPNLTCGAYFREYMAEAGGQVMNPVSTGECLFCPITDANSVISGFGVEVEYRWRDFAIFTVYVMFNILVTFGLYWLARVPKGKKA